MINDIPTRNYKILALSHNLSDAMLSSKYYFLHFAGLISQRKYLLVERRCTIIKKLESSKIFQGIDLISK